MADEDLDSVWSNLPEPLEAFVKDPLDPELGGPAVEDVAGEDEERCLSVDGGLDQLVPSLCGERG